jgi:hypothetical protein
MLGADQNIPIIASKHLVVNECVSAAQRGLLVRTTAAGHLGENRPVFQTKQALDFVDDGAAKSTRIRIGHGALRVPFNYDLPARATDYVTELERTRTRCRV